MHSVTLEISGSPRKRTLSRGLSEDESLRCIIKETESSSRRLTRSDSRAGFLKKRSDSQQSDQDILMGLPEMLELQANYDEVVQELRGLEVERETLLFQVDFLQDTLEGVEELLAEAQREAGHARLELEQEREAKSKLESTVCSLMQEVEKLKEERYNKPSAPANEHSGFDEVTRLERQMKNDAKELMEDSSLYEPHGSESRGKASEDEGQSEGTDLIKLRKLGNKPLGHMPSLAVDNPFSVDGVLQRPYENDVKDGQDPSSDRADSDSISAYEDASAETPEQDRLFPGNANTCELPYDSEKSSTNNSMVNDGDNQNPKNPDACLVS
ncbi:leucine-rich repeat flightless-interacting protein 1 isoform X1 [Etheostoma spectabile]|uniref:leucine-rich repeat flightless-interacting protein 1 isoform X1 n=1 Tax=Etheostoma spectabile TaxID=54343 RepID=UPI0013AF0803|nr:leucine-rich repeat flightless-interacting protein 1-like isoform X1 [Etheostoma spectabile]